MADFFIGIPIQGLPILKSFKTRLVTIETVRLSFVEWASTLQQLVNRLQSPNHFLPGVDAFLSDADQLEKAVKTFLRGLPVQVTNGPNLWTYNDDVERRAYSHHLLSQKKRKRGVFIPGVKHSKNRDAQFMRIRVPHS